MTRKRTAPWECAGGEQPPPKFLQGVGVGQFVPGVGVDGQFVPGVGVQFQFLPGCRG